MEYFFGKMEIAIAYGIDVAIFIENMRYWSETNAQIRENFIDGRYWVYYSLDGFSRMYPIWSRDQVKRLIVKCKNAGLLLTADYNDNPYKRTKWYSLSDTALDIYGVTVTNDGLWRERHIDNANSAKSIGRNRQMYIGRNRHMYRGKRREERRETERTPKAPFARGHVLGKAAQASGTKSGTRLETGAV